MANVYVVADTSPASTPSPDYRAVFFKTDQTNDGQPVYQKEGVNLYLWYDSGTAKWYVNAALGNAAEAGYSSSSITGDYTAVNGASGAVNSSAGKDFRLYLKEKDATLVYSGLAGIPRTKEMHRRWDKIKDKETENCINFLHTWTSAENYQEQYYVDSPRAVGPRGDDVWDGRWRLVANTRQEEYPDGILQILRFGFQQHTGNASDPIDQAEARLGRTEGRTGPSRTEGGTRPSSPRGEAGKDREGNDADES